MTTRARLAQGVVKEQFEGRVRKWKRTWSTVGKTSEADDARLQLLKWVQTDEVTQELAGPRHPHIKPVKDPKNKAVTAEERLRMPTAPSLMPEKRQTRSQAAFAEEDMDMLDTPSDKVTPQLAL